MNRSNFIAGIENSPLENIDVKNKIFLAGSFDLDTMEWATAATNQFEVEQIVNNHLEGKGFKMVDYKFEEDWDGENTVYTIEVNLKPIEAKTTQDENNLYNEFIERVNKGHVIDNANEFHIWFITDEVKAWIENNDEKASQIIYNAIPIEKGFRINWWQWRRRGDDWTLIAEFEY